MTPSSTWARPRWSTPRTPERPTYGPAIARVSAKLGYPFMPWQRHVHDIAGEVLPDGRMAYPVVVLLVPRRAGKTRATLALGLQRCSAIRSGRAWYTAQTGGDAGLTFREEWVPYVASSELASGISTRLSNGSESLRIPSRGSRFGVFAPTERALHGQDADLVVVDEAWAFSDLKGSTLEAALRPTMLTRPQRQLWIISAGGTDESTWLLRYRELGRSIAGLPDQGIAYFEWHPEIDAAGNPVDDLDDPETWLGCHPAIGYTVDLDSLKQDRKTMGDSLFRRSYLNVFQSSAGDRILPEVEWKKCVDPDLALNPGYGTVLAYDVAMDGTAGSIVLARRGVDEDGSPVLEAELVDYRTGTSWMVDAVAKLRTEFRVSIAADSVGPASRITRELLDRGITVETLTTREYVDACAELLDDVKGLRLRHRGQGPLDAAASGAARRELGDAWAWTRKKSSVDVSPVVALSIAAHKARHKVSRGPRILSVAS